MPATHHAMLRVREGDIIWLAKIKGLLDGLGAFRAKTR